MNSRKVFMVPGLIPALALALAGPASTLAKESKDIVHDAEYYILEAQNGQKWSAEDKTLDQKLTELRKSMV